MEARGGLVDGGERLQCRGGRGVAVQMEERGCSVDGVSGIQWRWRRVFAV